MDEPDIPPQAHFLYDGRFTEKLDAFLLEGLVMQKKLYEWRGLDIPREVMLQIHRQMNFLNEVSMDLAEIYTRVEFLQKRFKLFKALVHSKTGTHWDLEQNKVTAHYKTWRRFFEADAFNMAYYWAGEPQMRKMLLLFAMDEEIKQEDGKSVIMISDSTEVAEGDTGAGKETSSEVNSPVSTLLGARRRLFTPSMHHTHDEGSTTQPHDSHYGGQYAGPPPYFSSFHESHSGDEGSHCASSDPYSPISSRFKKQ